MWFISDALAQTAPAAQPGGAESMMTSIGFMVLIFVVFYFLLIRPQQKRQKEHKALIDGLNKGDEVLTAGGIVGKITDLSDQYMTLQVASVDNKPVEISMQRQAVQMLLPKGTMKSI
ncbi:MAG TPA: preprotein translocase subunit YajC [Burkholderiaceae bacterium]|jgi:preprotein translocase subunit YajC|nr:preprotein translocase subunit YajC [Burkholderiaceae bacterium]